MRIETTTRRANFLLFAGLVAFAIVLCAAVLLWMRARTHAQGGKVYPPVGVIFLCHPERSVAESKAESARQPKANLPPLIGTGRGKILRLRTYGASLRMTEDLKSPLTTKVRNSLVEIVPVLPLLSGFKTPALL